MNKENENNAKRGRPQGSLNARTQDLFDIAQRLNCNPFEVLLYFAKGDYEALGYENHQIKVTKDGTTISELTISPELRQKAAKDACEYLYPKRKAIEIDTSEHRPLHIVQLAYRMSDDEKD